MPVFTSSKSLIAGGNKNNYKYCVFRSTRNLLFYFHVCVCVCVCVCACVCVCDLFIRTKLSAGISFNYTIQSSDQRSVTY